MGLPQSTEAKLYYRAAIRRYEDAVALLAVSETVRNHTTGAMYLAGYAVECMLKALILESTRPQQRAEVSAAFRGPRAHDFAWLRAEYRRAKGPQIPDAIFQSFVKIGTWTVMLRYSSRIESIEAAKSFFHAVRNIVEWAKGRM